MHNSEQKTIQIEDYWRKLNLKHKNEYSNFLLSLDGQNMAQLNEKHRNITAVHQHMQVDSKVLRDISDSAFRSKNFIAKKCDYASKKSPQELIQASY